MLWFTESEVASLLPMRDAVDAVAEAFELTGLGEVQNLPRQRVKMSTRMFHNMFSGSERLGFAGLKTYSVGREGASFHYQLYDSSSGRLVAMMEADRLGQIRTGAASGVATRLLSRENAHSVGIIGTGWQARSQLEAVCEVREVREIVAFGRDVERRERFCAEMSETLRRQVLPVDSPELVARMDIVITATTSRVPVLLGEWLQPGQHVNAVGSNFAHRRELDDAVIDKATLLVADDIEQAKLECGDLLPAIRSGLRSWDQIASLGDMVSGRAHSEEHEVWQRASLDLTVFLSQGVAIEDLAVAKKVYEQALAQGVGTSLF